MAVVLVAVTARAWFAVMSIGVKASKLETAIGAKMSAAMSCLSWSLSRKSIRNELRRLGLDLGMACSVCLLAFDLETGFRET